MQQDSTIPQPPETNPQTQPPIVSPRPKKEGWKNVLSTILILAAAPIIAIVLTSFVFQSYEVDGKSMETTLQNHDRLIVNKIPRSIARIGANPYIPNRGDIIVFHRNNLPVSGADGESTSDKQLIKRVIALPGERVVVTNNVVTIYNEANPNGFNPDSAGIYGSDNKLTPGNVDLVVGENQVFVMGDNRTNSLDSRSFGPIASSDIVGKLAFRFYPFSKAETF